jgi:hypothetical protein
VVFAYLGNLKPAPAGQDEISAESGVLAIHLSESAKKNPCPAGFPLPDLVQ